MSFFAKKLGIDLGTANTLVFIPGKGIIVNEPSVVAISLIDKKVVAVGSEAKDMIGKTPDEIMAYQPMRDGVIADYKVTEIMLRHYFHKALGNWNFFKPDVMISVPAGATSNERRAVIEAALHAGAGEAFVIQEPVLAAIGAGIPIHDPEGHMIVDIGGGTTDVAVISLGGIVTSTSVKCAGYKLDQAIADYIRKTYKLYIGDKTAERIKIEIGGFMPLDEELEMTIKGRDQHTGLPKSIHITTNEIVRATDAEQKIMIQAIKDVLQDTPPELAADIIDNGIILTGGTSYMRNFTDLIFARTGVRAEQADEALYCVAKGTGIALQHLDSYKNAILRKRQ